MFFGKYILKSINGADLGPIFRFSWDNDLKDLNYLEPII